MWKWVDEYGGRICDQLRRIGSSVDWSRKAFTMDDNLSVSESPHSRPANVDEAGLPEWGEIPGNKPVHGDKAGPTGLNIDCRLPRR